MPVLGGKCRKRSIAASNPPADPPMPTIGHIRSALAGSGFPFACAFFDCDNFLPLVFLRAEEALDFAFPFAAMCIFMLVAPAHHTSCDCGGTSCPNALDPAAAGRPCRQISAPSAMVEALPRESR